MTEKPHGLTSQQLHTMEKKKKTEMRPLQAAELKIKDVLKKDSKGPYMLSLLLLSKHGTIKPQEAPVAENV